MDEVRTAGPRAAAPSAALRTLAFAERMAARAARHSRLADAVVQARSPKLLRAATRISHLVPVGSPTAGPTIWRLTRAPLSWAAAAGLSGRCRIARVAP